MGRGVESAEWPLVPLLVCGPFGGLLAPPKCRTHSGQYRRMIDGVRNYEGASGF